MRIPKPLLGLVYLLASLVVWYALLFGLSALGLALGSFELLILAVLYIGGAALLFRRRSAVSSA